MRITHLTIDNIRSHRATEIPMDRLTLVHGNNHSGKSTIEQALEFAFTGRAEVTDDQGRGQQSLLRLGSDRGAVTVEIDDGREGSLITLRATLSKANGRDVGAKKAADKSWNPMGFLTRIAGDRNVLSCLLNNRYFVELPENTARTVLAAFILPQHYDFDLAIQQLASEAGLFINWTLTPFVVIGQAYKQAFDARTHVNRDLNNFVLPELPAESELTPEDMRLKIKELQDERSRLAVARERRSQEYANAQRALEALNQGLAQAEARLKRETIDFEDASAKLLPKEKVKQLQKIAGDAIKAKALDEELILLEGEMASNYAILDKLAGLGENLFCPTCEQKIEGEYLAKVMKPLVEHRNKLIRDQREKQDLRKALGDYEGARAKLDAQKKAEADVKLIAQRVNQAGSEVVAAKRMIDSSPEPTAPDDEAASQAIQQLDQRIEYGTTAYSEAVRGQLLRTQHAAKLNERSQLQVQQQRLEKLCQYFGPGETGIKAKLIAEYIGGFEELMNNVLGTWGYHASLSLEPYGFKVSKVQGGEFAGSLEVFELDQLSKSELFRFSIAFQVALAKVSGYQFVLIDGADMLDEGSLNELFLGLFHSELEQAIVLMTGEASTNPAPGVVWIQLTESWTEGTQVEVLRYNPSGQEVTT